MNREMIYFQKCDFLRFFFTLVLLFGLLPEHYMCILNIRFALFVAKHVWGTSCRPNSIDLF